MWTPARDACSLSHILCDNMKMNPKFIVVSALCVLVEQISKIVDNNLFPIHVFVYTQTLYKYIRLHINKLFEITFLQSTTVHINLLHLQITNQTIYF